MKKFPITTTGYDAIKEELIMLKEMKNFVTLSQPEICALYRRINDRLDYRITFDEFERHVWTKVRKETNSNRKKYTPILKSKVERSYAAHMQ